MAKIKKNSLKSIQTRNRVQFHRKVRSILVRNNSLRNDAGRGQETVDQEKLNREQSASEYVASSERLRCWAIKYNISKRAVSELLTILIALGMNWLPKDSRTLLSTPRHIEMSCLSNGKLWYGDFMSFAFL